MNTQRQSGRVAIKIDNIENKTNNFNQSEDSKNTKFIYYALFCVLLIVFCLVIRRCGIRANEIHLHPSHNLCK